LVIIGLVQRTAVCRKTVTESFTDPPAVPPAMPSTRPPTVT